MKKKFIAMTMLLLSAVNFLEADDTGEKEQARLRLENGMKSRQEQSQRNRYLSAEDIAALKTYIGGTQTPIDYGRYAARDRDAYRAMEHNILQNSETSDAYRAMERNAQ